MLFVALGVGSVSTADALAPALATSATAALEIPRPLGGAAERGYAEPPLVVGAAERGYAEPPLVVGAAAVSAHASLAALPTRDGTAVAATAAAATTPAPLGARVAADPQAPDRGARPDGAEPADPSPDAESELASRARRGGGARAWLGWAALACCALALARCGPGARAAREWCADAREAAHDVAAGDADDGALLPLVGPGSPLQHGRRATRPWRRLLALLARVLAGQRAGKGATAADKRADGRAHEADDDAVELAPLQRRGSTRRVGAASARWDSPQLLRGLSLPSLSRMISEHWLPRLLDSTSDPPALVRGDALRAICREVLPRRYAIKDWRLVYSTEQHGCSLHTAYARIAERAVGPALLLLLDSAGAVFGAYSSVPPRADDHYHGAGETCLFRVAPHFAVYRWSHANELFVLGGRDGLAFGSGPAFGLRIDDSFEFGSSGRSETFENECLASASEFRIVRAEIWGFD